jgi:hypothetical protein
MQKERAVMSRRLHGSMWILPISVLVLTAFSCAQVRITEHAIESGTVVVDATLGFCLNLASLQISDPSSVQRLVNLGPRESAEALRSMEPGFAAYVEQLATMAHVRPVVLFLEKGADPAEAARRHGLSLTSWPAEAPPALLAGPSADVLILFESIVMGDASPQGGGPVARARIASAAGMAGFALAQSPPSELDRRLYLVQPRAWKQAAMFEHTRCREPRPGLQLVTKLYYKGGATDTQTTSLQDGSWSDCKLVSGSGLRSVTVKQAGRKTAGRPVIIAASFFRSPQPGPLLMDWISVN